MGPLLAALVVIPFGQGSIGWFASTALLAIFVLIRIGNWYKRRLHIAARRPASADVIMMQPLPERKVRTALFILGVLVFSKYFYIASMTNYFTFFLMDKFSMSVQGAQYCLFAFLAASAAGTFFGGPVGDRHLGVDSRRGTLHVAAALCRIDNDDPAGGNYRSGNFFGILGNTGLRHRPDAGQGRHDRRGIFRVDVRTGRPRLRVLRVAGRPHKHRIYLSDQYAASAPGRRGRIPAESGDRKSEMK